MDDTFSVKEKLEQYFEESRKNSNITVIKGEFGIGKSFYISQFLKDKNIKQSDIVQIEAHPFDESNYSTLNQAIYKYIINNIDDVTKVGQKILQKAATLIPRFGQFISDMIDPEFYSDALNQTIRRAGINTEEPNLLGLINFFEEQSYSTPLIFYCKNIQWFDRKSWEILLQLLMLISEKKWFCILSYTTNAELPVLSHEEINSTILKLKDINRKPPTYILKINRWNKKQISILCSSIMQNKVNFSNKQFDLIFNYTDGLPLYVKMILDEFIQHNYISLKNNEYVSNITWDSEIIINILKDSVRERIKRVYNEIPESREILEVGSIIQDDFTDISISQIFHQNDPFNVLSQVEKRFRIIQYFMEGRLWKFEHYIIQDYIYRSLGNKARTLHKRVAEYLENDTNNKSYLKIAYNYRLGGELNKAAYFHLKEIRELLDTGCYASAAYALEDFDDKYETVLYHNTEIEKEYEYLKARCMFHNVQYQLAKESFTALAENTDDKEFKAECNRWIACILLKLESMADFNKALEYLEKAKEYYLEKMDYSKLGDTLLDFIVAYAHLNDKDKASELYHQAEIYYNKAKDKIGMLRLKRRSIIFMEPELSAPILIQTAKTWGNLNVPHEKIMCLNNAAVQYICMHNYDSAEKTLKEAIDISISTDNFGHVYINNNMGLIHAFKNNKKLAIKNFQEAKKGKFRFVEQLIVDVNLSAFNYLEKGANATYTALKELYNKATNVGEYAYIIPAVINLALAEIDIGNKEEGIKLLESIQKFINNYTGYEIHIWYKTLQKYYLENDHVKMEKLEQNFGKKANYYLELYKDLPKVVFITMEYWGDN